MAGEWRQTWSLWPWAATAACRRREVTLDLLACLIRKPCACCACQRVLGSGQAAYLGIGGSSSAAKLPNQIILRSGWRWEATRHPTHSGWTASCATPLGCTRCRRAGARTR